MVIFHCYVSSPEGTRWGFSLMFKPQVCGLCTWQIDLIPIGDWVGLTVHFLIPLVISLGLVLSKYDEYPNMPIFTGNKTTVTYKRLVILSVKSFLADERSQEQSEASHG